MTILEEQIQRIWEISKKADNKKESHYTAKLYAILKEINKKNISNEHRESLALMADEILTEYKMKNSGALQKGYFRVVKYAQKELNFFTKGYYTSTYMSLGISLGISLGVAFSLIVFDNAAYMGVGIALGIPLGIITGQKKDKQVEEEGRQLVVK